jgi:hypothetical protein
MKCFEPTSPVRFAQQWVWDSIGGLFILMSMVLSNPYPSHISDRKAANLKVQKKKRKMIIFVWAN